MSESQNNNNQNDDFFTHSQDVPTYTTADLDIPPVTEEIKPQKKGHSTAVVIISCVLAAIIGAASSVPVIKLCFDTEDTQENYTSTAKKVTSSSDDTTSADDDTTSAPDADTDTENVNITIDQTASSVAEAVALKCSDSVVGIRTVASVANFFGEEEQSGDGSGVIYTADGYIITNYHVIESAVTSQNSRIDVYIGSTQTEPYAASVIGYNISCDLAVIKIDAENLKPIELGNSDDLKIGQNVVTIGAPGGLEFMGSVTYGVISGLDRVVSTDSDVKLIQTDAAINPGNSGGALLDAQGRLVGINSSKIASVEFEGMGFAIPINLAKEKCDKIIARQNEPQAYLGANISTSYTEEVLRYYGYPAGAVVSSVVEGGPAAEAGIRRGDIITEFNGVTITDYYVLKEVLYECEPDTTVSATIYRNGKYYVTEIDIIPDTLA